ncbi:restriction endonuclease subunit S [Geitlerinema sp. PCC 9228]|uniref:restriction endonuclease subunit S n=1 Tax=Geitlerinema sp. PCC 9228 TaxID=111611 RepID=UPI0008F9D102|nr:restriction endonuclease subunit S [Geitlerinema sp. PCC 9228]
MNRWKIIELAEVCSVFTDGDWVEKKDQDTSGIRLIQTGNIGIGDFKNRIEKARYISYETFKKLNCKQVFEGDCLISRLPDPVGRACIIPDTGEDMITAVDCTIVRFKENIIHPKFFTFYSQSYKYIRQVNSVCTGTTRKRISRKNLAKLRIPLPPLSEQKQIVEILDKAFEGIDRAIANTEKNLANAREVFENYLNNIFSQQSEDWVEKKLRDLIEISHGYAFKGSDFKESNDSTKPIVLTPGNYTERGKLYFTPKNTKRLMNNPPNGYLFNIGDLTIVMTDLSSKMKILGKPAFIEHPNILHNQRIGRVIFKNNLVNSKYLFYFLQTRIISDYIKATATGTMVRHTAPKRILANNIYLPKNPNKQSEIVEKLDRVSAQTERLEAIYQRKLESLQELKQSLLHKAFTGELTNSTVEEIAA